MSTIEYVKGIKLGLRQKIKLVVVCLLVGSAGIYLNNASWRAAKPQETARLLAHRGVHQTFDLVGIKNDSCTATRIREPIAPEIENTIGSMRAAFELGAEVVELDVHPTTDGQFAVFHDWTVDCRTQGSGETRNHTMAYLKSLDIGYGYTADNGKTFPLRGKGVGLMPTLAEVFAAFPGKQFLIDFKSNEAREGDMLAAMLVANPDWRKSVWGVYGGGPPTRQAIANISGLRGFTKNSIKNCFLSYLAFGWSGIIPQDCHNTIILVPTNYRRLMWGWPHLFAERMQSVGTDVIMRGDYEKGKATGGIDTPADATLVPGKFNGLLWTNEITTIAPIFKVD